MLSNYIFPANSIVFKDIKINSTEKNGRVERAEIGFREVKKGK